MKRRKKLTPRPQTEVMHRFRSNVLGLAVVAGRVLALTERGPYLMDRNGKRWRKVAARLRGEVAKLASPALVADQRWRP